MKFGDQVAYIGCIPYGGAHPDCWRPPHRGTLVPYNDPRLWFGTLAFGTYTYPNGPTQEQVDTHIAKIKALYDLPEPGKVGVVWEYERNEKGRPATDFVNLDKLQPYAEGVRDYRKAKAAALWDARKRRHEWKRQQELLAA